MKITEIITTTLGSRFHFNRIAGRYCYYRHSRGTPLTRIRGIEFRYASFTPYLASYIPLILLLDCAHRLVFFVHTHISDHEAFLAWAQKEIAKQLRLEKGTDVTQIAILNFFELAPQKAVFPRWRVKRPERAISAPVDTSKVTQIIQYEAQLLQQGRS
jgi:hypothetical protein